MAVAVLAGYGTGKFNSAQEVLKKWVKIGREFEPDAKKFKKYQGKYEQWLQVSESLDKYKIIY